MFLLNTCTTVCTSTYLIKDIRVERHNCNTIVHIRILREKVQDDLDRLKLPKGEILQSV